MRPGRNQLPRRRRLIGHQFLDRSVVCPTSPSALSHEWTTFTGSWLCACDINAVQVDVHTNAPPDLEVGECAVEIERRVNPGLKAPCLPAPLLFEMHQQPFAVGAERRVAQEQAHPAQGTSLGGAQLVDNCGPVLALVWQG